MGRAPGHEEVGGGGGVFHTMEQFCVKKMIDRSLRNEFVYYL